MPQGTIKTLVTEKGYGFIEADGADVFFHHSSVEDGQFDNLQTGMQVQYEIGSGPKGPRATNVRSA